jgi:pSer/pThr/pTyr-binding forkhead associated (FHA) protein
MPKGRLQCIENSSLLKRKPLELVVLEGGGRGARHSLTGPHVVLGRLDSSESPAYGNLLFPEPTVSRLHATLDWDESANRYLLTHRSATNATLINKLKVTKPRHVGPGDKIQMGKLLLELRVGIGQHAEVELETVDFSALTKRAANQVYRPETVMPEPPAVPAATPQPPQEAPIPAPIPPPARRPLPAPVFHEPYAPIEIMPTPEAPRVASLPLFEFPDAEEQVSVVREAPRKIQLSSLPRREEPKEVEDSVEAMVEQAIEDVLETESVADVPEVVTEPPDAAEPVEVALTEAAPAEEVGDDSAAESAAPEDVEEKPKSKPFRREVRKVGRNEKCPCGSGRKYKKCCGR